MSNWELLRQIRHFLGAHGMSESRFGRNAMGDTRFVSALRNGREVRSRTQDKVIAYMVRYEEAQNSSTSDDIAAEIEAL